MEVRPLFLDLSGAYGLEGFASDPGVDYVGLTRLEGVSCYLDESSRVVVEKAFPGYCPYGIHFIDSGDYHYITYLLACMVRRPYCLVLIDNHPDMQPPAFGPVLSCGAWLRQLLQEDSFLVKAYVLGIDPALESECGGFGERVVIVNRDKFSVPALPPDLPVYISVDKDVLSPQECATGWSQGTLSSDGLLSALETVFARNPVIAVDICGELTPAKGADEAVLARNAVLNRKLMDFLLTKMR